MNIELYSLTTVRPGVSLNECPCPIFVHPRHPPSNYIPFTSPQLNQSVQGTLNRFIRDPISPTEINRLWTRVPLIPSTSHRISSHFRGIPFINPTPELVDEFFPWLIGTGVWPSSVVKFFVLFWYNVVYGVDISFLRHLFLFPLSSFQCHFIPNYFIWPSILSFCYGGKGLRKW